MRTDWPFDQAPNVAAITTRQVLEDKLPILCVTHYSDDHSWAFVCGTTDVAEDGSVIAMCEALDMDPTLRTIADLPPGWTARRNNVGEPRINFATTKPERLEPTSAEGNALGPTPSPNHFAL